MLSQDRIVKMETQYLNLLNLFFNCFHVIYIHDVLFADELIVLMNIP